MSVVGFLRRHDAYYITSSWFFCCKSSLMRVSYGVSKPPVLGLRSGRIVRTIAAHSWKDMQELIILTNRPGGVILDGSFASAFNSVSRTFDRYTRAKNWNPLLGFLFLVARST